MQTSDDMALVRDYVANGSNAAFESLVERHVNLVYSAALRQVEEPLLAKEVVQTVFIILSRKAASLREGTILSGWLYRTTQFVGGRALRTEYRRKKHEREASQMETEQSGETWAEIAPLLEEAMAGLREKDRNAVVLRYFENKGLREVGAELGTNERAAQKRIERAINKLRGFFIQRGVAVSVVLLTGVISSNAVQTAPMGMAAAATAGLRGAATTSAIAALVKAALQSMTWLKVKAMAMVGTSILAGTGATALVTVLVIQALNHADQGAAPGATKTVRELYDALKVEEFAFKRSQRALHRAFVAKGSDAVTFLSQQVQRNGQGLDDATSRDNRLKAARLLGGMEGSATNAIPALIQALRDEDGEVRRAAASSLGRIGPAAKEAVPALLEDFHFQGSTAGSVLMKIDPDSKEVAMALLEDLQDNSHPPSRSTIEELGEMKSQAPLIVPVLQDIATDADAKTRAEVVRTLEKLEGTFPEAKATRLLIVPNGENAMAAPAPKANPIESGLLRTKGNDEDALKSLLEALHDPHATWTGNDVGAIGDFGPAAKPAVPLLLKLMDNDDIGISGNAINALGRIGPEAKPAVAKIVKALDDPEPFLRWQAANALWRIDPQYIPKSVSILGESFTSLDPLGGSWGYARILGQLGRQATAAIPELRNALASKDHDLRIFAAMALVQIDPAQTEAAVSGLIDVLKQRRAFNINLAVDELGKIGLKAKAAIPVLQQARSSSNPDLRASAAKALKEIDPANQE